MPSGKRIGPLRTIDDVSVEYRRIYRLCRNGKMDISDGKSYCWMLKGLSAMITESDLESRIIELEGRLL